MRKVTKPAIVCDKCGSILSNEEYDSFCDYCKTKIPEERYEVGVFWKNHEDATHLEFCSLKCARAWLLKFPLNKERVEFIVLPYIHEPCKIDELLKEGIVQHERRRN